MSLVTDSPIHSSSSCDFAAILDAELDSDSDTSVDQEDEDDYDSAFERIRRRKVELLESTEDPQDSTSHGDLKQSLGDIIYLRWIYVTLLQCVLDRSTYKAAIGTSGHPSKHTKYRLWLYDDEIVRLCNKDLKTLLRDKKLYLVLDLDLTLLNSTRFRDVRPEEEYLKNQTDSLEDVSKGSLFRLDSMHMLTKLRPFVRTFLKEASKFFEMYIYTMGERSYALEMEKLLDPRKVYFHSRVLAQDDCTQRHQKGLDVIGKESAVLILDDTEQVFAKHKENLILMERYHFFASSCRLFGYNCKSLSQLKSDESGTDGALATVLKVLKRIHSAESSAEGSLKGCKVVFSRVFSTKLPAESHHLWKMAEQLGATCSTKVDPSVTNVISADTGTEKSRWAVREKKFLVNQGWIEVADYLWQKQPEQNFPVIQMKCE